VILSLSLGEGKDEGDGFLVPKLPHSRMGIHLSIFAPPAPRAREEAVSVRVRAKQLLNRYIKTGGLFAQCRRLV
jgi:hypothetical protein